MCQYRAKSFVLSGQNALGHKDDFIQVVAIGRTFINKKYLKEEKRKGT